MLILELLKRKESEFNTKITATEKTIFQTKNNLKKKEKVREILNKILYIKKHEMNILSEIVNIGLDYAYPEKDLKFRLEFQEKNNKIVPEFYLNDLQLKNPFIGDGGGIISMISLLLYITLIKLQKSKVVLLDEIEAMVDIEASNRLFQFLNTFAKDNDINIILITHKQLDCKHEAVTEKISILKGGVEWVF